MSNRWRIALVSGARPNFMKIAPVLRALETDPRFDPVLVHTGQHYDDEMATRFFRDLGIRSPDVDLEVGSASHGRQTGTIMIRFDKFLDNDSVDCVVVVGDVNSTIACTLVAVKRGVMVAHVEAGLRSYDREMPEEVNRVLTDSISDLLFTTEEDALSNLEREGIDPGRVHFVGNVMVDTLFHHKEEAMRIVPPGGSTPPFGLVTIHRPSNVDEKKSLKRIVSILIEASAVRRLVFPVHPRTGAALDRFDLRTVLENENNIELMPPLGYLEFLRLLILCDVVLTDSGGIQEESTALGVPCITLRENTERPITVSEGTNEVCGTDRDRILQVLGDVAAGRGKTGRIPARWDGRAAERIVEVLARVLPSS